MENKKETYWKTFLGLPRYKIDWYCKYFMYKAFGVTFEKMKSQNIYWNTRGVEYYGEFFQSEYYKYEEYFQDIFIENLKELKFDSFFEAGCGFGWNVKRVKKEFGDVRVGGLDFSMPQLLHSKGYLPEIKMPAARGDACKMPFKDDAFDVGFTLGVFMNIHGDNIGRAIDEMIRVSKKYVIHLEWDQENTTPALREKRIIKTNIVSHDYRKLYEERGKKVIKFQTYKEFGQGFMKKFNKTSVSTWEQFEGPEKYIVIVVEM